MTSCGGVLRALSFGAFAPAPICVKTHLLHPHIKLNAKNSESVAYEISLDPKNGQFSVDLQKSCFFEITRKGEKKDLYHSIGKLEIHMKVTGNLNEDGYLGQTRTGKLLFHSEVTWDDIVKTSKYLSEIKGL